MKRTLVPEIGLLCAALVLSYPAFSFPITSDLYVQPTSEPFIETSGGSVVTVNDSSGSISTAQTALNNAHTSNPSAVIVLNLSGTYSVSSAPLNLTSNTCVVLASGTLIKAASSSITPTCLIQIHGQSNVSVAGGSFNGEGASVNAIQVETSNHVNIDDITVTGCGRDGIYMTGNGNSTYDNENTVTRCTVSGGTSNGIKLQSGTQYVCIDNSCTSNTGAGIYIGAAYSTVTNNTCTSNGTGIIVNGTNCMISDNQLTSNPTGISMTSSSASNVIASNHPYSCTTVGIVEAGTGDTICENYYKTNTLDFSSGGTSNNVMAYKAALSAPSQNYFYPPILSNEHTTTTIVNGLGRYDLTIGSDTIADVQSQYNSALSSHSTDVIVLHLTGSYTGGNTPLTLSSNTCVLLTGTIQMSASGSWTSAVTAASGSKYISFSGGTIDGGGRGGAPAINFNGCGMLWIQGVTVQNFGVPTTRTSDGMIDVHTPNGPVMISSCTLNEGGGRGIWTEGTGPYVITDNTVSNVQMDGVDLDSHTQMALVKFNTLTSDVRYGVFVEQADSHDTIIANTCTGAGTAGVGVYNNAETDTTQYNSTVCNDCNANASGLRNGSTGSGSSGLSLTSHNFAFNNTATNNTNDGINGQITGSQNYYSQTILGGNGTDIVTSGSEVFFNSSEP